MQQLSQRVVNEIKLGRKIGAIKLVKEEQGIGLKEAKGVVETYIAENPDVEAAFNQHRFQPMSQERKLQLVVIILLLVGYYFYQQ